jgi:hypothetical protein
VLLQTHRLLILHKDDSNNLLVKLKLNFSKGEPGIYKAGKSYVINSRIKTGIYYNLSKLREKEGIIPDIENPEPYELILTCSPFWWYKEFYCDALNAYVYSIEKQQGIKRDGAYLYITDLKQKIEYLENRLTQLTGRESLSVEIL